MYDGTWSSGELPAEIAHFELMREMHWSWPDLQAAPFYVRRYCWDLMLARRRAQQR